MHSFMLGSFLVAEIISVATFKDIQTYINNKAFEKNKAILFSDVNMTLVMPENKAVRYPAILAHKLWYFWITSGDKGNKTKTMITLTSDPVLVEKDCPQFLKTIGVKTILFSACVSGKIGKFASAKDVIFDGLKKLGIDQSATYAHLSLTTPVFYKGILFSEPEKRKPEAMVDFLKAINQNDLNIVMMIDDRKENLNKAESALKKAYPHMQFIGFEYTGAYNMGEVLPTDEFKAAWNEAAALVNE